MELGPLLAGVRSIRELTGLLVALGHEPRNEPAPELVARVAGGGGRCPLVIGRTGEFPWYALEGRQPGRLARLAARRLARRGRLGAVLALDPRTRQLAIAVALEGTPSLEFELDDPSPTALASIERLSGPADGALAYAVRAADALSGQAAGRRFFREFRATLDRMAEGLPSPLHGEDRRSLALLQLTRVLFLYFVQAKGWLAGRDRFLAEELDRCLARRRIIHRDLLRPLFFGTLNRPAAERTAGAARFGRIPFLNGGLFEPHPLERALRGDIPNELWRDAFDGLFERFHFTVSERGTSGAIAPDMLGRVFEGVMAPDARRASGTFYTPAALVRALLDDALAALIAGRLRCPSAEAARRLAEPDAAVRALLDDLTILDPAAGSGAFLLGALDRLSASLAASGTDPTTCRRRILQRNLFGVDRSATAVRLTELRLWLAVIAEDRESHPDRVEPLPNLDCLIRQGDSLMEPAGAAVRLRAPDAPLGVRVATLRRRLVMATGAAKKGLVRELRGAEARAADAALATAEAETRSRVADSLRAARSPDLFGARRGLDRELRARVRLDRATLRAVRAARRTIAREGEVPWFHYQTHFADVFAAGGFDLVTGNPPWLRAEEIPAELRARLSGRYRWWRGGAGGFGHRPDLAVAFLERAVELAKPGGVVGLLVPAKLATARYAVHARHALAAGTTLVTVADLTGRPDAAFDATVYPLALVSRLEPPASSHHVRTAIPPSRVSTVPQPTLCGGGPWILTGSAARSLRERLARDHPPLSERFACHLGVKTGANAVFLCPPAGVEPEVIRWAVRGRDLSPFRAQPRVRLLWTHDAAGAPLARLPPGTATHLAPHEAALRRRTDLDGGPPWTLFRTRAAMATHRVVWSDLARRLTAAALTGRRDADRIPLNTCYVAPARSGAEAERLAAWLNSTSVRGLALIGAVPAAGGFFRHGAGLVGALPLPADVLADPELSVLARLGRRGDSVQEALDDIVARRLGLSARDRRVLSRLVAGGAAHRR